MFLTVTPIDGEPLTLNFTMVQSFTYHRGKSATEISLAAQPGTPVRKIYVEEPVEFIQELLALDGLYTESELSDEEFDEHEDEQEADDNKSHALGKLPDNFGGIACIAFGDHLIEARYDEKNHTIRPYLYSPQEAKYLGDAITATPENLASLIRELANVIAGQVVIDLADNLTNRTAPRTSSAAKKTGASKNRLIRLIKSDDNESKL
jgi:hypothetical protein